VKSAFDLGGPLLIDVEEMGGRCAIDTTSLGETDRFGNTQYQRTPDPRQAS
jgi:hypothetical protein